MTTEGGTATRSNVYTYVNPPVLSSITPNTINANINSFNATLTGTSLTGTSNIILIASDGVIGDFSVSNIQVVNDNTVTATITNQIHSSAYSPYSVYVVTPLGNSNSVTLTVTG